MHTDTMLNELRQKIADLQAELAAVKAESERKTIVIANLYAAIDDITLICEGTQKK